MSANREEAWRKPVFDIEEWRKSIRTGESSSMSAAAQKWR